MKSALEDSTTGWCTLYPTIFQCTLQIYSLTGDARIISFFIVMWDGPNFRFFRFHGVNLDGFGH